MKSINTLFTFWWNQIHDHYQTKNFEYQQMFLFTLVTTYVFVLLMFALWFHFWSIEKCAPWTMKRGSLFFLKLAYCIIAWKTKLAMRRKHTQFEGNLNTYLQSQKNNQKVDCKRFLFLNRYLKILFVFGSFHWMCE